MIESESAKIGVFITIVGHDVSINLWATFDTIRPSPHPLTWFDSRNNEKWKVWLDYEKKIMNDVENTGNGKLGRRVLVPCERTIPEPSRFSLFHHGKGQMIDHLLVSRTFLTFYRGSEIHNELLHDESVRFTDDKLFPESDHAPVIAKFVMPEG